MQPGDAAAGFSPSSEDYCCPRIISALGVHKFFPGESRLPSVPQQECNRRVCAHSLVAVDERMVPAEMKKVRCRHRRDGLAQEFAGEGCLGRGYIRLKSGAVAETRGSAVPRDLLLMVF
jgi:hypothetical protein